MMIETDDFEATSAAYQDVDHSIRPYVIHNFLARHQFPSSIGGAELIVFSLLAILAFVVITSFLLMAIYPARAIDYAMLTFPAVVALVGVTTGFYMAK